jgi:transposase
MTPISNEKRELLIAAKKRGETEKSIAKWLEISTSSVTLIWKQYRKTGGYLPAPYPGRKPILTAEKFEEAKKYVTKNPDATLEEIIEALSLPIHKSRLSVLLIEAGFSLKKDPLPKSTATKRCCRKARKMERNAKRNRHSQQLFP